MAAAASALATGPLSFYLTRFLLGVAEAGFFPGVIWYLSIWFPARYRTQVLAWFMAATPVSSLIGGPVSGMLLEMNGLLGLAGWQWMFIVEGLPASLLGLWCLKRLADTPEQATWLTPDEHRVWLEALAAEKRERPKKDMWAALRDPRVLILTGITFSFTIGSYGIGIWLPLILRGHGLGNLAIGFVSAIPYFFATFGMLLWARQVGPAGPGHHQPWRSPACSGAVGLVLSVLFADARAPALVGLTLALIGTISARTVFYTIPSRFLTGAAAAGGLPSSTRSARSAASSAPPWSGFLKDATGSFSAGMLGLAGVLVVADRAHPVTAAGHDGGIAPVQHRTTPLPPTGQTEPGGRARQGGAPGRGRGGRPRPVDPRPHTGPTTTRSPWPRSPPAPASIKARCSASSSRSCMPGSCCGSMTAGTASGRRRCGWAASTSGPTTWAMSCCPPCAR